MEGKHTPFQVTEGMTLQRNHKTMFYGGMPCDKPMARLLVEHIIQDVVVVRLLDNRPGSIHTSFLLEDITDEWFIPD